MSDDLSGYYSGDVRAARSAYSAHVARGDVRPGTAPVVDPVEPAGPGEYEDYDGDLEALLAALH
ncbi:MAG: hypothetical protein ACXV0U_10695 [Kineosporiaceae bacterium]